MAETTAIAWADATFNPWIGCQAISPGCDHCYAEAYAKRVGRDFANRTRTSEAYWREPYKWDRRARESGKPWRVFCASLADVFDNDVPQEWRLDLWDLIRLTPNLQWMLLTKRIGNARAFLPAEWTMYGSSWPSNLWLGITVVNQEEADRDIPKLLSINARIRFLSIEPQLGRVDLCETFGMWWNSTMNCWEGSSDMPFNNRHGQGGIDWVINGGESGHHARQFDLAWARTLRNTCRVAGAAFFMKQLGRKPIAIGGAQPGPQWMDTTMHPHPDKRPPYWVGMLRHPAGADPAEWPEDLRVQEFPT